MVTTALFLRRAQEPAYTIRKAFLIETLSAPGPFLYGHRESMTEHLLDIFTTAVRNAQSYLYLFPAYAILLGIERIAHHLMAPKHRWDNKDAAANIVITLAAQGLNLIMGHIFTPGADGFAPAGPAPF